MCFTIFIGQQNFLLLWMKDYLALGQGLRHIDKPLVAAASKQEADVSLFLYIWPIHQYIYLLQQMPYRLLTAQQQSFQSIACVAPDVQATGL